VYDFGSEVHHSITLEKIAEPEKGVLYPRIVSKNKPEYRYCELCTKEGKETIATWICIECSEGEGRSVLLCEDCLEGEHCDHYADEIVY
ncbi:MAG: hypothetical protein KAW93_03830, partial [Methanogenium sp.]|nr:hypothetical protein [Methanogenium sp.]